MACRKILKSRLLISPKPYFNISCDELFFYLFIYHFFFYHGWLQGLSPYLSSIKGTKYLLLNLEQILFDEMSFRSTGEFWHPQRMEVNVFPGCTLKLSEITYIWHDASCRNRMIILLFPSYPLLLFPCFRQLNHRQLVINATEAQVYITDLILESTCARSAFCIL